MTKQIDDLEQIEKKLHSHPFVVSPFLRSPHIQTAFAGLVPFFKIPMKKPERQYIQISNDTKLAADCWFQKDRKNHATVVFLNGFEGYSKLEQSNFSTNMSMKAYHLGFNVIHLKQRGEADTIHMTKSIFTTYSGLDDIKTAVNKFGSMGLSRIYLAGLSYGGYLLFHTINRLSEKERQYVRGIVTISAPMDIFKTWKHIEKNKVYDRWLLRSYKHTVKRRAKIDSLERSKLTALQNIKTKRQFMETYMHTFGYPKKSFTLDEYARETDAETHFSKYQLPLLIISSSDDPITPTEAYMNPDIINNPYIITLFTKYGGHGGFITFKKRYGDLDGHWAQNRAMEFITLMESTYD